MRNATYEQMAGSLGSLLLLWARIERAAQAEIVRGHGLLPKQAHGIAATLRTWQVIVSDTPPPSLGALLAATLRDQLQHPLDVRNGLCHGLIGIESAGVASGEGRLTWHLNGSERQIDWAELQESFRWLSKVPSAIGLISHRSFPRAVDNAENREWWLAEFGIELP